MEAAHGAKRRKSGAVPCKVYWTKQMDLALIDGVTGKRALRGTRLEKRLRWLDVVKDVQDVNAAAGAVSVASAKKRMAWLKDNLHQRDKAQKRKSGATIIISVYFWRFHFDAYSNEIIIERFFFFFLSRFYVLIIPDHFPAHYHAFFR